MRKMAAMFAVLALFTAAAFAHGHEQHLMGTVTKVSDKLITIEGQDKKKTDVSITAGTKCMKGNAAAAVKDIKVGDRVVINAEKSGDKLVATMVKIGAAPTQPHKHQVSPRIVHIH